MDRYAIALGKKPHRKPVEPSKNYFDGSGAILVTSTLVEAVDKLRVMSERTGISQSQLVDVIANGIPQAMWDFYRPSLREQYGR